MRKIAVLLLNGVFALCQQAYAVEGDCRSLSIAGSDNLEALVIGAEQNALLQINFDKGLLCTVHSTVDELDDANSANFHINAVLGEFAVQATVDGSETWLRIDNEYDGELLLDRSTGEELGLTDAEFLGDNSMLEASDFFIEYVGRLEMGGIALRNVETNIPLLEVPYDHYTNRGPKPENSSSEAKFLTVGSVGTEILEEFIMTLDIANQKIYMTEAN